MLQQIADFRAEGDELYGLLASLGDADWDRATLFKGWTVNDIVQHLHDGDAAGLASAESAAAFEARAAGIRARRDAGLSRVAETRQRMGDLTGKRLLDHWRVHLAKLCDALAAKDPGERLAWAGPGMGVRMFATARQMETWSHGQAIYDLLGLDRPPASPRLRNVAEIGVRTFGWAYRNRGLPVPPAMPYVSLDGVGGETWEWNPPSADNAVTGDAVGFCHVVAQVRNVADTTLSVVGDTARHWMTIVQCFAGPPETPPAPGARYKAAGGRR